MSGLIFSTQESVRSFKTQSIVTSGLYIAQKSTCDSSIKVSISQRITFIGNK